MEAPAPRHQLSPLLRCEGCAEAAGADDAELEGLPAEALRAHRVASRGPGSEPSHHVDPQGTVPTASVVDEASEDVGGFVYDRVDAVGLTGASPQHRRELNLAAPLCEEGPGVPHRRREAVLPLDGDAVVQVVQVELDAAINDDCPSMFQGDIRLDLGHHLDRLALRSH